MMTIAIILMIGGACLVVLAIYTGWRNVASNPRSDRYSVDAPLPVKPRVRVLPNGFIRHRPGDFPFGPRTVILTVDVADRFWFEPQ